MLISTQMLVRHRGADRLQPDRSGAVATGGGGSGGASKLLLG